MKLVFLKNPDASPTEGIRSSRALALTSVMSTWYASCVLLRVEKEKEPGKLRSLHMGRVDGISYRYCFAAKTLGMERREEPRDMGQW